MSTSTIEYRIVNAAAGHVFSERFLSREAAWGRISEYRDRGDNIQFLTVFTMSAPKFHWLEGEVSNSQRSELTTLILGKTAPSAADAIIAAGWTRPGYDYRDGLRALQKVLDGDLD